MPLLCYLCRPALLEYRCNGIRSCEGDERHGVPYPVFSDESPLVNDVCKNKRLTVVLSF